MMTCIKCGIQCGGEFPQPAAIPDYENGVWYCENDWGHRQKSEKIRRSWEIRKANQALRDSMYD